MRDDILPLLQEKLQPGIVGLIDEHYGEPMCEQSNERMITDQVF